MTDVLSFAHELLIACTCVIYTVLPNKVSLSRARATCMYARERERESLQYADGPLQPVDVAEAVAGRVCIGSDVCCGSDVCIGRQ